MALSNKQTPNLQQLLTPLQVSEIIGVTTGTLQVWRCTGAYNLPYVKCGGRVMYRPDDIQDFIMRRTLHHTV